MNQVLSRTETRIAQEKRLLLDCFRENPNIVDACQEINIPSITYFQYRDADPDFARMADAARNPQSMSGPVPSYFYPSSLSVFMCPKVQPHFIGWHWWQQTPEKFRAMQKDASWSGKLEFNRGVVEKWKWCPDAIRLLDWAKRKIGTDIEPIIVGGYYGVDEKTGAPGVQLMIHLPGHPINAN